MGALILTSAALSHHFQAPGPLAQKFNPMRYTLPPGAIEQSEWLRAIPTEATVVAQNEYIAHVSNRKALYEIPSIPDYRLADYLIVDTSKIFYVAHKGYVDRYLASGYFLNPLSAREVS